MLFVIVRVGLSWYRNLDRIVGSESYPCRTLLWRKHRVPCTCNEEFRHTRYVHCQPSDRSGKRVYDIRGACKRRSAEGESVGFSQGGNSRCGYHDSNDGSTWKVWEKRIEVHKRPCGNRRQGHLVWSESGSRSWKGYDRAFKRGARPVRLGSNDSHKSRLSDNERLTCGHRSPLRTLQDESKEKGRKENGT